MAVPLDASNDLMRHHRKREVRNHERAVPNKYHRDPGPDALDDREATRSALPSDQQEVDLKAAHQLLPAILRLATRRLVLCSG